MMMNESLRVGLSISIHTRVHVYTGSRYNKL